MNDDTKTAVWIVGCTIFLLALSAFLWFTNRAVRVVDTGIIRYEQFQEIHNTCTKLNTDLCNMRELQETDVMFEQFSKAQRINTIKTNLNRWVEDYNAKSKTWTHSMWKSGTLPYQLSTNQFNCY